MKDVFVPPVSENLSATFC